MKIFGLDFTSAPTKKKAITYAQCSMGGDKLELQNLGKLTSFEEFEGFLDQPGPWVMGMDFPFGQPRKLIENIGWPRTWEGYVHHVVGMSKVQFVETLAKYRASRPVGDKQHLRRTDELANSRSPMMLFGVPVGKMFFEGAPRLLRSGACIQPCCVRNDPRIIVEAYPALVARRWVGSRAYKSDTRKKQTPEKRPAREEIVSGLRSSEAKIHFGFDIHFSESDAEAFFQDASSDQLDGLLCAVQAGWAYSQRERNFGIPTDCDRLEGWIVNPRF